MPGRSARCWIQTTGPIIGPHYMSALEALASPPSENLTLSATRYRLDLVRDRMKNALDALDQSLISQGLSTTT
jgi:hypothetical protein